MQPYFFPYVGYFSLIEATDTWVVFDSVQFIRHGWIERNRIINSNNTLSYIKVPLIKHSREAKINEVLINNSEDWKNKIIEQLTCYKKRAPHYYKVISFLKEALHDDFSSIAELNTHLLKLTCNFIGLDFNYQVFSKMETLLESKIQHAGQWALEIAKSLNANTYINPVGGKEIFHRDEFESNNIELHFLRNNLQHYEQKVGQFFEGLSIIDVLMYNSPSETLTLIKDYKLEA